MHYFQDMPFFLPWILFNTPFHVWFLFSFYSNNNNNNIRKNLSFTWNFLMYSYVDFTFTKELTISFLLINFRIKKLQLNIIFVNFIGSFTCFYVMRICHNNVSSLEIVMATLDILATFWSVQVCVSLITEFNEFKKCRNYKISRIEIITKLKPYIKWYSLVNTCKYFI